MTETLNTAARVLADTIEAEAGSIFVLTGAGVSVASGIPTFRGSDPDAVWTRDVTQFATRVHFVQNPVSSWQWYRRRFAVALQAKPNAAHIALATLERWHLDRRGKFLLVTQNIDTLHEQAGSTNIVKVHGSADRARCSNIRCALGATQTVALADLDFEAFEQHPRPEAIPRCQLCGALMRPHILWFDEMYTDHSDYAWPKVVEACKRMHLVLAVGTSFSVGVTDFVQQAATQRGVHVLMVDPGARSDARRPPGAYLRAKAEELLPMVTDRLVRRGRAGGVR